MNENNICSDDGLNYAKKLVECIEQGNLEEAEKAMEDLSALRESHLFQELGKLTRDLHDTMVGFQLDSKISNMAETDISDAAERLNHVITLTEQAAEKTLSAVETSMGLSDSLRDKSEKLNQNWKRFRQRDMDVDEFRTMSAELDEFFLWLDQKLPEMSSSLSDIMLAQGFQDLTGQIIGRVITLVQDVEEGLVGLIRMTGQKMNVSGTAEKDKHKDGPDIEAVGPAVPGVDKGDIVNSQDDVDDLLSSLGF